MPKAKSAYSSDDEVNDHALDPLIDALLNHLPAPGDPFADADRKLWMQILELALQLIYPKEESEGAGGSTS